MSITNVLSSFIQIILINMDSMDDSHSSDVYRLLFEKASESIFLIDKENKIIECNPKTLEMFKLDHKSDIIGLTPVELSPTRQANGALSSTKALEIIQKAMAGTPQVFEWLHKKKDGKLFNAEVSLNRVVINDEKYLLAVVRDISHRHLLEELHEIYDKVISVALNNLFVASRGYISLVIDSGELSETNVKYLQKSLEKHETIENIIEDFESHKKVQLETRFVLVNLKKIIERSLTLIKQKRTDSLPAIQIDVNPNMEVQAGSLLQNAMVDYLDFIFESNPEEIKLNTQISDEGNPVLIVNIINPVSLDLENVMNNIKPVSDFGTLTLNNAKLYIALRILDLYSAIINVKRKEKNIVLTIKFQEGKF